MCWESQGQDGKHQAKFLWDCWIQTDRTVVVVKKEQNTTVMDVATQKKGDVRKKEHKKFLKILRPKRMS